MSTTTAVTDRPTDKTNVQPPIFDQIIARAKAQFPAQNQSPEQKLTIPEQTDVQAWQEIERQRGLGKSDKDIWFDAVRNGNLQIVGAFIRKPPARFDINQKDGTGETALNNAIITNGLNNNLDMVKLLVNDGRIDMAALDDSGTSAYSIAAQYTKSADMREIADFLKGKLNGEAETAYRNGDDKRLDALYQAGADKVDGNKVAADVNKEWFDAVKHADYDKMRQFIRDKPKGWDINAKDARGQAALDLAVRGWTAGDPTKMTKFLIDEGHVDMAALAGDGRSALQLGKSLIEGSCGGGAYQGAVDYLQKAMNGEAVAVYRNGDGKRLDALYAAGADKVDPDKDAADVNKEWLDAVKNGDYDKMRQFIKDKPKGWDINAKDAGGETALDLAVRGWVKGDSTALTKFLIDEGHVDTAVLAGDGRSALQLGKSLIEGSGGGGAYQGAVDYLQKAMDDEAKAAYDNDDAQRFDALKAAGANGPDTPPVPGNPPTASTKRPDGDHRSADEIIKANPLLANLGEREKKQLAKVVGDYTKDPDAAYRASKALDHIENYAVKGDKIDADGVGIGQLDGYTKAKNGEAEHGSEAGRFKDFVENDYDYLKSYNVNRKDYVASKDFANNLQDDTYASIIKDAKLPDNRQDILDHPENYSVLQRYAAQLELTLAGEKLKNGAKDNYDESGAVEDGYRNGYKDNGWRLNSDPNAVLTDIQAAIGKLNSPDVQKYGGERYAEVTQAILAGDPARRAQAESLYNDMKNNAVGLDQFIGDGKDTLEGMRTYVQQAQTLNDALGTDGKSLDDNFTVDIKNSPQYDAVVKAYETEFRDPDTLKNLVEKYKGEGQTQEQAEQAAFTEFNSRTLLFSNFGSPQDEITSVVNENIQHYTLGGSTTDDFAKTSLVKPNGELDEALLTQTLEEIQKKDPGNGIFKTDSGNVLTPGQIVVGVKAAWDGMRNLGKVNDKLPAMQLSTLFDRNGFFQQKLFASGIMHSVSTVFSAAIVAARVAGGNGHLSGAILAATLGSAIQTLGIGTQSFEFTQRPNPRIQWGNVLRPGVGVTPPGSTVKPNLMNAGKTLNGLGGLINGAASIAVGVEALRKGDKGAAGLWLTLGISNTLTAIGPVAEAGAAVAWSGVDAATRTLNTAKLFVIGGAASFALNVVASLGTIAGVIYGLVAQQQRSHSQETYFNTFSPTLHKYGITGGKFDESPAPFMPV